MKSKYILYKFFAGPLLREKALKKAWFQKIPLSMTILLGLLNYLRSHGILKHINQLIPKMSEYQKLNACFMVKAILVWDIRHTLTTKNKAFNFEFEVFKKLMSSVFVIELNEL